ncbi:hypothetical protein [Microbacterium sp. NPDC057658]|uniref:antitoxin VbhA family protein n=1 Tax=unclassified Microbacterium TaxID=2609290 RepID=UPI00366C096F
MTLSRDERFIGALEALHSGRLDGLPTTPAAVRDAWDYVEGRRTLDQIIEDVIIRHTRVPEGLEELER